MAPGAGTATIPVEVASWVTKFVGGDGSGRRVMDEPLEPGATVRSVLTQLSARFPELHRALWHGSQLGENIGIAARAMLNCALSDFRLVAPRDGWPNLAADRASVGALELMPPVRVFDQLGEAIADLTMVYATTARDRQMVKQIVTARHAAVVCPGRA